MTERKFDLAWRPEHLPAMLTVMLVAAVALAARAGSRTVEFERAAPVVSARVSAGAELIDPNTACVGSLRRLPGIGPVKARAIVEHRDAAGGRPFHTIEDLTAVHGIGPGIVRDIRRYVALPEGGDG